MSILHPISSAAPLRPVLASRRASHGAISSPVLNVEYRRQSFPALQISAQNSNVLRMGAVVDDKSAGDVHHVQDVDEKPTDDWDVRHLIDSVFNFSPTEPILDDKPTNDDDDYSKSEGLPDDFPFKASSPFKVEETLENDRRKISLYVSKEFQSKNYIDIFARNAEVSNVKEGVPMTLWDNEMLLFIEFTAYPDTIDIHSVSLSHAECFTDFVKFLEIRGINLSTARFMRDLIKKHKETAKS